EPAMIPIYQREESILPPQERRRFRQVLRDYLAMWTSTLQRVVPDVSEEEARTTVVAAFGTMNCIAFHRSTLGIRALERLLVELAGRTLGVNFARDRAQSPSWAGCRCAQPPSWVSCTFNCAASACSCAALGRVPNRDTTSSYSAITMPGCSLPSRSRRT